MGIFGSQNCGEIKMISFVVHEILLEHHKDDIEWFSRGEKRTWTVCSDFSKTHGKKFYKL